MPETDTKATGLRHAVFLQRMGDGPATAPEVRLGQGAFLVLRLLDLFAPEREPPTPDAFLYQWTATERYCVELEAEGPEGAHLLGLVRIADEAHRRHDVRLLAPGLLAYAHYLEDDARYEEALDVLETLLFVGQDRLKPADATALRLRLGRLNRKMALFDEAERWYSEAGELAEREQDRHSALLSRVGRANCLHGRGNLGEAERSYRDILAEARHIRQGDVEARAEHGLAAALYSRGSRTEALPHVSRAFRLYEDEPSKLRALNDMGIHLLALGRVDEAERALTEVVRRGGGGEDNLNNALIELMHCASYRRDQVTFERHRSECDNRVRSMAPNILADFLLKCGIGQARFGHFRKAEWSMKRALEVAQANGLHELEFRIERILGGLPDCKAAHLKREPVALEPAIDIGTEAQRELSASLAGLST